MLRKVVELIDKKLKLILNCPSPKFYDNINSFMYGFHLFKAISFIKLVLTFPNVNYDIVFSGGRSLLMD